jgi:hypothetical protein
MPTKEIQQAYVAFADEVLNASKRELGTRRIGKNRNYGVATRTLQKSLKYRIKYGKFGISSIEMYASGKAAKYANFVHWGVNGTRKRRGAPYSYTNKQPPTTAVMKWMKAKPVRLRDENGKFVKQTPKKLKSAAFLIARSIKRNGVPGVFYFEKGYNYAIKKKKGILEQAVAADVASIISARLSNTSISPK